jgi:spermidine synthase
MSQAVARLLVFFTSAAVLVIEILAQRLLAPYLGVSLEVVTGVIGVILAGIAIGAWAGGRAADRMDPAKLLGPILIGGGLSALAAPIVVDIVGPAISSAGPLSIVMITTVGFFLPAAILSSVPPVVVKLRLASLEQTGTVVGSYSAVGTAGGIFGTFATGFVLIAAFPTRPIVIAVGTALVVAGIVLWGQFGRVGLNATAAGLVLVGGMFALPGPCDFETTYSCAVIELDLDRPGGRTLILDQVSNSYVDLDDPTHLEFRYARVVADVIHVMLPEGPLTATSIGGGGFTFDSYLKATRPGSRHVTLEIDAELVEIGHEQLGLAEEAEVIVGDARRSLPTLEEGTADLVFGDAFSGLSVPWHLTTVEFVEHVAAHLAPGGTYVMNVIDYGDLDFVRSEVATLQTVFPHVAVFAPPTYLAAQAGGNFVLVASASPIPTEEIEAAIRARGGVEIGIANTALDPFVDGARPLTDDFAPVDQMIDRP